MAYETPLTIAEIVNDISANKYVLPSIQREFVWGTPQIERLFDSIMQGYPIGTFLFWELTNEQITSYTFYSFLQNYHEKNARHNPRINLAGNQNAMAVLDGQQRLTSIYIGLKQYYDNNEKSFYNPKTGRASDTFKQLEITHGYALTGNSQRYSLNDDQQYSLIDLETDKTISTNFDYPYHYLCDYQNGSIFLATPDKDNSSDTFPMQLAFCDHDDHSAIVFELTAHPDIEATLQGKRFLAKNISLEQYGKSLVLQHEDSGMITKVDILKAKNLSSLLRMTENFCGE